MNAETQDPRGHEAAEPQTTVVRTFLSLDYEIKVRYYSDHMQRVWTRFNFFITLQSGLLAGLVFSRDRAAFTPSAVYFLIAEAALSLIWYVFGAQDRYLIADYRRHIKDALAQLRVNGVELPDDYPYAGKVEEEVNNGLLAKRCGFHRRSVVEGRWKPISITRLPAVVPLVLFVFWVGMIVLHETGK
jgi:hypothetical protein